MLVESECCIFFFFALFLCPQPWAQPQHVPATQVQLSCPSVLVCLMGSAPQPFTAIRSLGAMLNPGPHSFCLCPSPSIPILCYSLRNTHISSDSASCLRLVCLTRKTLLNYSCRTCCNFKGRDLVVLSHHHAANDTGQ